MGSLQIPLMNLYYNDVSFFSYYRRSSPKDMEIFLLCCIICVKNKESRQKSEILPGTRIPAKPLILAVTGIATGIPVGYWFVPFLLLHSREKHLTLNQCAYPEGNSREPVSWSSGGNFRFREEIFWGKCRAVREAQGVS